MKIVIFGATGNVGRKIVARALAQGHEVRAFARDLDKISQEHENLEVVQGDVLDHAAVVSAMRDREAVVCALGMPLMNKDKLRARGTKNIVRAMEEVGVSRLVCLSALGAGDSRSALPLHYRYLLIPLLMRRLYEDHELQEEYVKSSQVEWAIVRPGSFVKGEGKGSYWHGTAAAGTSLKFEISHDDVAEFMLRQLTEDTYLRQTPGISYASAA